MRLTSLYEGKGIKLPDELDAFARDMAQKIMDIYQRYIDYIKEKMEAGEKFGGIEIGERVLSNPFNGEELNIAIELNYNPTAKTEAIYHNTMDPTIEVFVPPPHRIKEWPSKGMGDFLRHFYNLIVHELTHIIDPGHDRTRDKRMAKAMRGKKGPDLDNHREYLHMPEEVTAWTSEIASFIRRRMKVRPTETQKEIAILLKTGEAPVWFGPKYAHAIEVWREQPLFWKKRIVPVLHNAAF
jgi:hypothetical protein